MLPSCRNQIIDLLRKSIVWFLYDENIGHNGLKDLGVVFLEIFLNRLNKQLYPLSAYAKYPNFRKILRTYLMDGS